MLDQATMDRCRFGQFVRYHRLQRAWSVEDLARKSDLPVKTLKSMELAGFTSDLAQHAVCQALGRQWQDHQTFVLPTPPSFKKRCGTFREQMASNVFSVQALKLLGLCALGILTVLMLLEQIGVIQDPLWKQHLLAVMTLCVYLAMMVFAVKIFTKEWSVAILSTALFCVLVVWEAMR